MNTPPAHDEGALRLDFDREPSNVTKVAGRNTSLKPVGKAPALFSSLDVDRSRPKDVQRLSEKITLVNIDVNDVGCPRQISPIGPWRLSDVALKRRKTGRPLVLRPFRPGRALGVIGTSRNDDEPCRVRRMKLAQTDSSVAETDFEGTTARVLLPVSSERPGKIRVNVKGSSVDIAARSREGETIERGTEVLVVRMGGGEALVTTLSDKRKGAEGQAQEQLN